MSFEPGGIGLFSDIFLFSVCLIFTGVLIFILIYFIITLSDLECDYLNAEECCGKLNFVSISKLIGVVIIGREWDNFLIVKQLLKFQ